MHTLVILGMHRSGTSAVARVCNLLGADLGSRLLPAQEDNPTGFWELEEIVCIHDELLAMLDRSWHALGPLPEQWWRRTDVEPYKGRLTELLRREFSGSALPCVKDPRMCRLLPLWQDVFQRLQWTPHYLLCIRHPLEVAESLKARNGFNLAKSSVLWLYHVLEAERWTRGAPRALLSYDALLAHWRGVIKSAWLQLSLDQPEISSSTAEAIDDFLRGNLKHHMATVEELEEDEQLRPVCVAYKHLLALAREQSSDAESELSDLERGLHETGALFAEAVAEEQREKNRLGAACHVLISEKSALQAQVTTLEGKILDAAREIDQARVQIFAASLEAESHRAEIHHLTDQIVDKDRSIDALRSSTSWRVTAPLRGTKIGIQKSAVALRGPIAGSLRWLFDRLPMTDDNKHRLKAHALAASPRLCRFLSGAAVAPYNNYREWVKANDTLDDDDRAAIRRHIAILERKPLISVIMPVFNPPERFLRSAIQSVIDQLYDHWELCIADDCSTEPYVREVLREYGAKNARIKVVFRPENGNISACSNSAIELATGDYLALLDHDDVLPEHALYMVAVAINEHPNANIIYSDEDKIDEHDQRNTPYFKTDWNPDLFYGQNMINHLGVYRTSAVREISGFRLGFEGSQDYDLALRMIERTAPQDIVHIPRVLYHWRISAATASFSQTQLARAVAAAHTAIREHFARLHIDAQVESAPDAPHYQRIRRPVPQPAPLASLIIPTKDKVDLLQQCIDSILSKTAYASFEVIIVDNGSVEPETHAYLGSLSGDSRVRVIKYDQAFNYSAINNYAIREARGDIVGLINNDIIVINEDWLTEMVSHAVRPEVGAVGAMLYYPDDTVQHAGIIMGIGGVAGHGHRHVPRGNHGYFERLNLVQNVSGVTGACLLTRREILAECGGLDDTNLSVAFNDVDLCLRIRKHGYLIVWTPYAQLYHLESASRGADTALQNINRFRREQAWMRVHWGETLLNDPYYNPNLTLQREDFSLASPPRTAKPWVDYLAN